MGELPFGGGTCNGKDESERDAALHTCWKWLARIACAGGLVGWGYGVYFLVSRDVVGELPTALLVSTLLVTLMIAGTARCLKGHQCCATGEPTDKQDTDLPMATRATLLYIRVIAASGEIWLLGAPHGRAAK